MDVPYRTYRSYIKERFGKRVLKIPINGGFTCPNRDGTVSSTGCAFCDNAAFSPVATDGSPPGEQLRKAILRAPGFDAFIAYLQPFSNTYGPVSRLRSVYEPLITHPRVVGLAVGTRPDCLPSDTCAYLADVGSRTYLTVELGLQSAEDQVLKRCNRGHSYELFEQACRRLEKLGIQTVAHVIIGLPGQTEDTVCRTADRVASLPIHGVKLHQLMVIDGTRMAQWFREGSVPELSLDRYAELAGLFLSRLRPDQCIHRVVADTRPERGLISPPWSAEKPKAVSFIRSYLVSRGIRQGSLCRAPVAST